MRFLQLASIVHFVLVKASTVKDANNEVRYHGTTVLGVEHYQNIKYAHDTSGDGRFSPPVPYKYPLSSEVDATLPGVACPQSKAALPPFFSETDEISEDCLTLRIARPAGTTPESKLPVVVWIHGGGVVKGSAYDPHFDPDRLVALSDSLKSPIIYVALNYRITSFGFASLPLLKKQNALNVGMKDQEAGFRWIRENIEAFGGDPTRVTAYGLSAGGTMSSLHLLANRDKPPFTQMWAMSGPPGSALNVSDDAATFHTLQVAKRLQCDQEDEQDQLKCLRKVPMQKLLETSMEYSVSNNPPAGLFTFIPTVDGDIVPDRSTRLYRNGRFAKNIPTVLGWTQDDGAMNAGPANLVNEEKDIQPAIKRAFRRLTSETITELLAQYKPSEFTQDVENYQRNKASTAPDVSVHWFRLSRMLRDILFACPSIDFGFEMNKQSQNSGVYLYSLNQSMLTPVWGSVGMPYIGISHGSDTNYIFNGLFPEGESSDGDQKLSVEFSTAFITFANTGSLNQDAASGEDAWLEAFPMDTDQEANTAISAVNLQIIGGPYGTGRASLVIDSRSSEHGNASHEGASYGVVGEQQVLGDDLEWGGMPNPQARSRKYAMDREHLLRRCAFINRLSEELGV